LDLNSGELGIRNFWFLFFRYNGATLDRFYGDVLGIFDTFLDLFGFSKKEAESPCRRIWAIGDIQGCHDAFMRLLEKIAFDPVQDRLWIAGDLVNRGGGSLEVLTYLYSIRDRIDVVLGNHDITLLAVYWGLKKSNPTLDPILASPEADKLIGWLRTQPFVHYDKRLGYVMAHAGIPPAFDLETALHFSRKLQEKLQSDKAAKWLDKKMLGGVHTFGPLARRRKTVLRSMPLPGCVFVMPKAGWILTKKVHPAKRPTVQGSIPGLRLKTVSHWVPK